MLEGTPGTGAHLAVHTDAARRRLRPRTTPETRRRDVVAWLSALSLAGLGRPRAADRDAEVEATAVARAWLDFIDQGRYTVGWTVSAPTLKDAIREDDWETAVRAARGPLGRCHSRALRSRATVEAPPAAPRGPWAVIRFEGRFERGRVTETVTACRGDDGRWRVAAYFVA